MDQEIMIGDARAKAVMRTRRCAATQVNPATAERDLDIPKLIKQHFGHTDMGVYAEITICKAPRQLLRRGSDFEVHCVQKDSMH